MKRGFLIPLWLAISPASGAPLVNLTVAQPQQEWLIGDPMVITVIVQNNSPRPFLFSTLSPYSIAVTDAAGQPVYNPQVEMVSFGGAFMQFRIDPASSKDFKVALAGYADFENAGTYRVNLKIDEGSERGWPEYPSAQFEINVRLPTAEEAQALVSRGGYSRFTRPIFLEPLKAAALEGRDQAVYAIGHIPNADATRTLLELIASDQPRIAQAAQGALAGRLAMISLGKSDSPALLFGSNRALLKHLTDQAPSGLWDERARTKARQLGRQFAKDSNRSHQYEAAQLLGVFGDESDIASLIALIRADLDSPEAGAPEPAARAVLALSARSASPQGDPAIDPVLAYLDFIPLKAKPAPRPAGWQELVLKWAENSSTLLRESTVRSIPYPAPPEFDELLQRLANDPNERVRAAVLFVTKHEVQMAYHFSGGFGPKLPPATLKLEKNGTSSSVVSDCDWEVNAYSAAIAEDPKNADAYDQALKLRPKLAAARNRMLSRGWEGCLSPWSI